MKRLVALVSVLTFGGAVAIGACGGVVSHDDPGSGSNGLGGSGADGGATDGGSGGGGGGGGGVGDWPWTMGAFGYAGPDSVDGAVLDDRDLASDQLNDLIWMAWWPCEGAICTQNFQINADCKMYWIEARTDRPTTPVFAATATLSPERCAEIKSSVSTFVAMVNAPDPATPEPGTVGAEALHVMLGPSPGNRTTRRIEAFPVSGIPFGEGRKLIFGAYEQLPAGKGALHFAGGSAGP
jgi:hypothetical protein